MPHTKKRSAAVSAIGCLAALTLLPLLCIVMLPAWLLLAGRPLMIARHHTD